MNINLDPQRTTAGLDDGSLVAVGVAQAPFAVLLFLPDDNLTLVWRNHAHEKMSMSVGVDVIGMGMFEAFPPNDDAAGREAMQAIQDSVRQIVATQESMQIGPYRYDLKGSDGGFAAHHWMMRMSPVLTDGQVTAIMQTATDVTEQVLNTQLANSLQRAAAVTAAVSFFKYDPVTDHFERSEDVDRMFGFEPDEAGDKAATFFERVHPDDLPQVHAEVQRIFAAPRGELAFFDYRVNQPDGSERFIRIRAEVSTDPVDRREKLVGSFVDLTDVENDRRALKKALSFREALVKEANHRIKNSLAIALSILRMEKRALKETSETDDRAVEALTNLESRIRSISSAHGLMQLDANKLDVSLHGLMSQLVAEARSTADLTEEELSFSAKGDDIHVSSDKATSVGLIVNEMLTNALKYGLNTDGEASISVVLDMNSETAKLQIVNQVEKDAPIEAITSTKIGSMLAAQIASDLNGLVSSENEGERYITALEFPVPSDESA